MAATKKTKFTFPQLALLDWLFEKDRKRLYISHSHSTGGTTTHYYEVYGTEEDGRRKLNRVFPSNGATSPETKAAEIAFKKRMGGRENIDTLALTKSDFFSYYNVNHSKRDIWEKFAAQFSRDFSWYETAYVATQKARDFWAAEGQALFENMKAKRAEEEAAVERWVVVGKVSRIHPRIDPAVSKRIPEGIPAPMPSRSALRPQALCRVVKETELRLYVDEVIPLASVDYEADVITGREPNRFVERAHVIMDHADEPTARRLQALDEGYREDLDRIATQALEEMLPTLNRLADRMAQKDAEREDMMREIIEGSATTPRP